MIARRTLLALAASALAPLPGALAQQAPRPAAFSSITVDVRPLLDRGLGGYAERVRAVLAAELARAFADRSGGPGPRLVVLVKGVSLNPYAGSGSRPGWGGGTTSDYLDGEALILDRGGQVLRRHPQLSAVPASSGGAWYDPESENRRLVALAAHYAAWLRRDLLD